MPKFDVTTVETLTKTVTVDAEDESQAFWKVCDGWKSEDYRVLAFIFLTLHSTITNNKCWDFAVRTHVWITDGKGWHSSANSLRETFSVLDTLYNITDPEHGLLLPLLTA